MPLTAAFRHRKARTDRLTGPVLAFSLLWIAEWLRLAHCRQGRAAVLSAWQCLRTQGGPVGRSLERLPMTCCYKVWVWSTAGQYSAQQLAFAAGTDWFSFTNVQTPFAFPLEQNVVRNEA